MLRVDYDVEYGEILYRQTSDKKLIVLKIHWANALCAFIFHYKEDDGTRMAQLVSFFADEQHLRNYEKSCNGDCLAFVSDVGRIASIKLNLYYKQSQVLLKHFVKAGHKVTCYYKKPKL